MASRRVLLCHARSSDRARLRSLLGAVPDVEVVAEAGDGYEALTALTTHRPNLVLVSSSLPGPAGAELVQRVKREAPQARVIVMSPNGAAAPVFGPAMAGSVDAHIPCVSDPDELAGAIRAVETGDPQRTVAVSPKLTPRQEEVLRMIAEGLSTREIAKRLLVSVKTVETHRAQLMRRLQIFDVAGLVKYAVRVRLVSLE